MGEEESEGGRGDSICQTPAVKIGVDGLVGSGKTAWLDTLCKCLGVRYDMAVITDGAWI
jgi:Ni2+-binding GTPase involved in maturation of urease and hydrogenase